ncbi:hypothetical protein GCM10018771_59420 [Streptomyces cellulosae]|nr:hypothetical protein GCM10018771_59420 [Streptomyces cellulosae]
MSPPRAEVEPTAYHRRAAARCSGMDSTETARRLLGHGAASRPYAQLTGGHVTNTPIYAELVAEWRAKGHTVPGHREGLWASFAVVTAGDHRPAPAVPFRVPVPLLAPEGATDGGSEEAASQETAEAVPSGETPEEEPEAATEEAAPQESPEPNLTNSPEPPSPH